MTGRMFALVLGVFLGMTVTSIVMPLHLDGEWMVVSRLGYGQGECLVPVTESSSKTRYLRNRVTAGDWPDGLPGWTEISCMSSARRVRRDWTAVARR